MEIGKSDRILGWQLPDGRTKILTVPRNTALGGQIQFTYVLTNILEVIKMHKMAVIRKHAKCL